MNNKQDIKRIVENYYIKAGQVINGSSENTMNKDAKKAEEIFREGLKKLEALKLTPDDRRHIRLLRESFKAGIKSMQAAQRNNAEKTSLYGTKSAELASRYATAVTQGSGG